MPAKRMRVELLDSDGNRYTITFEGQITRDKALRLLDLVELLGGLPSGEHNPISGVPTTNNETSKYNKVRVLIQKHFPVVWFSSREVQLMYEQEFKEPISLSTVATYLARMTGKEVLLKAGSSNNLKYKLVTDLPQITSKSRVSG